MKKIILAAATIFSCMAVTRTIAQTPDYSLNQEKRDLRVEKRQLNKQEKAVRKEEKTERKSEVSYMTRQQFLSDFPNAANPVYTVGKNFEEVHFADNGHTYIAFYDHDSKLVGTTTPKAFSDLPENAQRDIEKRYEAKGFTIDRVIMFDDNEYNDTDMWLYNQPFDDQDAYFVELSKNGHKMILDVSMLGLVEFFQDM